MITSVPWRDPHAERPRLAHYLTPFERHSRATVLVRKGRCPAAAHREENSRWLVRRQTVDRSLEHPLHEVGEPQAGADGLRLNTAPTASSS